MFNIESFLKENSIKYYTSGKDVARGNINIKCPFCGDADKSWHMGINLKNNVYGCWKNTSHRGKDISYLISKLLNCSLEKARNIVYDNKVIIDNKVSLDTILRQRLFKTSFSTVTESKLIVECNLSEFDTFKTINTNSVYYRYLESRGFDNIPLLIDKYDLKFSLSGDFKNRIIFPVYINGRLVTWQGRDVTGKSYLKYKDLSKEKSVRYLKQCIYNFDGLKGEILYICEGVFDALKIDFYTPSYISATCVFTKSATQDQYILLRKVINNFKEIRIIFDRGTLKESNSIKNELLPFHKNIKIINLPLDIKDAGDMSKEQIKKYLIY
jgi:hypothetical protein